MRNRFLGASLYLPGHHKSLMAIACGELLTQAKSLIFCTEDAVLEADLSYALFNLQLSLAHMPASINAERYVRVRNPEVLRRVLDMPGVEKLSGFVIPKADADSFWAYFSQLNNSAHSLMPTLETPAVFCDAAMQDFRALLMQPEVQSRILALRIGGNDLLALLGIRRPRSMSIYETPLGAIISRLVTQFKPYGFELTAPVFEYLDLPELLQHEVNQDLAHGLVGKTAIHPDQISQIEAQYQVSSTDLEVARTILREGSPAVFKMDNAMCEVTTHKAWALRMIERAELFGVKPENHKSACVNFPIA